MIIKTRAILLSSIKLKDNSILIKLFTKERGLITAYVRNARSKTKKTVKWQITDDLNIELIGNENKDVFGIKEAAYTNALNNRYFEPSRSAIAFFIAESFIKVIHEKNAQTEDLFEFALQTIDKLEKQNSINDFPFRFLVDLSDYLGIKPRAELNSDVFNLSEGTIEKKAYGQQSVSVPEVALIGNYLITGDYGRKINREERLKMLQLMIDFYKYQITSFVDLKTLGVLKELFE